MKKKILLVGSVMSVLGQEKGFLDREIFVVATAASGKEAIEMHRRERFDVIVMDLDMPDLPGDEVCRLIKADIILKKVLILLATRRDEGAEVERCQEAGSNGHITKPVTKQALAESLARLLGIPVRQMIRILVKVMVEGRLGNSFFIANTVDVSVTGLLFECERELKVGDTVETSFFLPGVSGFNRIAAKSEVMRVATNDKGSNLYGVRFGEFREGSSATIREFIEKKTGKS